MMMMMMMIMLVGLRCWCCGGGDDDDDGANYDNDNDGVVVVVVVIDDDDDDDEDDDDDDDEDDDDDDNDDDDDFLPALMANSRVLITAFRSNQLFWNPNWINTPFGENVSRLKQQQDGEWRFANYWQDLSYVSWKYDGSCCPLLLSQKFRAIGEGYEM